MSPSRKWRLQHAGSLSRRTGQLKIPYASASVANDQALLMDFRYGVGFDVYPCRWGQNYRDGEVFPVHWHIGQANKHGRLK